MPTFHENLYNKPVFEPGASVRTSFEEAGDARGTHSNEIVLLGSGMKRGDPNPTVILKFRDSQKLKRIIGTGVIYDLARTCWNPSRAPEVLGANWINVIRVGTPGQASLVLTDGASAVLTATARDYGLDGNNIRLKVEAASNVADGKKITVAKVDDDGQNQYNVYDDLKNAINIQYVASGTDATMTITKTGDVATSLSTTVTGGSGDNLLLDLTDPAYDTISKLVAYISGQDAYMAEINDYADPSMSSGYLDAVAAEDIKTSEYTVAAVLGSIVHKIVSYDPFVSIERASGATATPANINYTYLAGGFNNTGGVPINTNDYITALTKLEAASIGKGILVPESTSEAVHTVISAWCKRQRENDNGRWKAFLGHPVTDITAMTIGARARRQNSIDCILATPFVKIYDQNNVLQSHPSTYLAAIMAGQYSGSGLDQPLTNNTVPIDALGTEFDRDDREYMIQSGCSVAKWDDAQKQFVITYALTTYSQSDSRFYRVLFVGGEIDYVEWNLKTQVENRFKGKKAYTTTPNSVQAYVMELLGNFETRDQILVRNPADPNSRAWTIPVVTITGGVCTIVFSASYADEIDFIDIPQKAQLQILQSVIRAQI